MSATTITVRREHTLSATLTGDDSCRIVEITIEEKDSVLADPMVLRVFDSDGNPERLAMTAEALIAAAHMLEMVRRSVRDAP